MKCKLVGYNEFSIIKDKETGETVECLTLSFVRGPKLSESGAVGLVAVPCTLYGDAVSTLRDKVELKIDANYDCDFNTYKGKNYLNDISELIK